MLSKREKKPQIHTLPINGLVKFMNYNLGIFILIGGILDGLALDRYAIKVLCC
jgi:hypothetical protein